MLTLFSCVSVDDKRFASMIGLRRLGLIALALAAAIRAAPNPPTVTDPNGSVYTNQDSYTIRGTAAAGSLILIYQSNGGSKGSLVSSQQLGDTETTFAVSTPLTVNRGKCVLGFWRTG